MVSVELTFHFLSVCVRAESNNFPGKLEGIVDGEITKSSTRKNTVELYSKDAVEV